MFGGGVAGHDPEAERQQQEQHDRDEDHRQHDRLGPADGADVAPHDGADGHPVDGVSGLAHDGLPGFGEVKPSVSSSPSSSAMRRSMAKYTSSSVGRRVAAP